MPDSSLTGWSPLAALAILAHFLRVVGIRYPVTVWAVWRLVCCGIRPVWEKVEARCLSPGVPVAVPVLRPQTSVHQLFVMRPCSASGEATYYIWHPIDMSVMCLRQRFRKPESKALMMSEGRRSRWSRSRGQHIIVYLCVLFHWNRCIYTHFRLSEYISLAQYNVLNATVESE